MEEEKKIEKIKLKELITVAKKYNSGEWDKKVLNDYGKEMMIRSYIPLLEKMALATALLTKYNYSNVNSQEIRVAELYKNLFFRVILEQYALIDCSDENLMTYQNYDLLYPLFANFILQYCRDDYNILKEYISDSLNLYNMEHLMEGISSIDMDVLKESVQENKKLVRSLEQNKDLIKDLNELTQFTDPNTKELIKTIQDSAKKEMKQNN